MWYKHLININTSFMSLIDKYLLAGGTLDISQYSEIIPDTSKACQNLKVWDPFDYYMHAIVRGTRLLIESRQIWKGFFFICRNKCNIT